MLNSSFQLPSWRLKPGNVLSRAEDNNPMEAYTWTGREALASQAWYLPLLYTKGSMSGFVRDAPENGDSYNGDNLANSNTQCPFFNWWMIGQEWGKQGNVITAPRCVLTWNFYLSRNAWKGIAATLRANATVASKNIMIIVIGDTTYWCPSNFNPGGYNDANTLLLPYAPVPSNNTHQHFEGDGGMGYDSWCDFDETRFQGGELLMMFPHRLQTDEASPYGAGHLYNSSDGTTRGWPYFRMKDDGSGTSHTVDYMYTSMMGQMATLAARVYPLFSRYKQLYYPATDFTDDFDDHYTAFQSAWNSVQTTFSAYGMNTMLFSGKGLVTVGQTDKWYYYAPGALSTTPFDMATELTNQIVAFWP